LEDAVPPPEMVSQEILRMNIFLLISLKGSATSSQWPGSKKNYIENILKL